MATLVGVGYDSYARYGYETTYGTAVVDGSLDTYFGHNVSFSASPKNNTDRIKNLNTRNFSKYAVKKFEGGWTADFNVSNMYWMRGVLGTVATTGSGPYTHTYNEADLPDGITIQSSENLDTDSERTFVGCVIDKATMTMNVGEVVTGRLEGFYQKESKDSTLNTTGNSTDSEEVFTFAHASLEYPNGTAKAEVQSLELSIANNFDMIWGLNSRIATKRAPKQRVYELRMSRIRELDSDVLDNFYGSTTTLSDPNNPSDVATLEVILTNGLAGTNERSFTMLLDSVQFEDPTIPVTPEEVHKEDCTMYALNLNSTSKAVYTNNTSSHP